MMDAHQIDGPVRVLDSTPRVSVCMPVSRNSRWFGDALRSVLVQSMTELEVVVLDDTGGALAPTVAHFSDSRIRHVVNRPSLGFAGNHCRAIDEATGRYVAFLHDDDAWEPEYLASACRVLDEMPDVGLVLSGAVEVDAADQVIGPRPARMRPGVLDRPLATMLDPGCITLLPSLTMVRREALAANTRPWPDVIAADLTMYIDVAQANWKLFYLDRPLVRYRVHPDQISTNELAHRHALVSIWSSYCFADPDIEARRRQLLARALVARAAALLRRQERRRARRDLQDAHFISARTARSRRLALEALSYLPPRSVPLATNVWRRFVRKHRHEGA